MPNKPDELDELHELLIKKLNTKKRMIEPHDERFVIGFQTEAPGDDVDWQYLDEVIMRYVGDSIRTEKLKLLAEVRERVVGEDRKEHTPYCGIGCPHDKLVDLYRCTCGLVGSPRNKQQTALTKLEAEL